MSTSNQDEVLEQKEKDKLDKEAEDKKVKESNQKAEILKILKNSYNLDNSKEELVNIFRAGKISSQMRKDLELSKKVAGEDYKDFDLSKIRYLDIVDAFGDDLVELNNLKESLKQAILSEYEIESQEYDTKFLRKIEVLSKKELKELLGGGAKTKEVSGGVNNREKFIKTVYGNKLPNRRNALEFFKDFNLEEKRKKLNKSDKRALDIVIGSFQKNMTFDYNSIHTLFDLNIFSLEDKLKIIHTFSPTISLDKLIESGVISKNTGKQIKQDIIRKDFEKQGVFLYDKEVKALAGKLRDDKIYVSTNKYIKSEKDIKQFVKTGELRNVSSAYNSLLNKIKENNLGLNEFKDKLRKIGVVSNPDNFKVGHTIVIKGNTVSESEDTIIDEYGRQTKNKTKKDIVFYAKIVDDGDKSGVIKVEEKGTNIYNSSMSKTSYFSYTSFLSMLSGKAKGTGLNMNIERVDFLSDIQIKDKIRSGEIKSEGDIIEFKDKSEQIQQTESENLKIYNQERDKLINSGEYEKIEKEKGFKSAQKWLENKLNNNSSLINVREELKNLEDFNLRLLLDKIDEIDSSGKEFGLENGTSFEADGKNKGKKGVYTIINVDKEKREIILTSPSGTENIDFQSFYQTFKEKSAKRLSKITNTYDLLNTVKNSSDTKISGAWGSFDEKDGGLSKKDEKYKYDFLVGTGGKSDNQLVKIHSISGGVASISFGEVETKEAKNKGKEVNYLVEKEKYEVTLGYLHNHIIKNGLIPKSLEAQKNTKEVDSSNGVKGMHNSLVSKFFHNLSVADTIAGFKLGFDSIEQYLKEGNDEHAAKFASGVFGKFLPKELKTDMLSRVESAQKKRMDEYSQKLKDLDTKEAVELVTKWLLNKDCPDYKKEAGMMFFMEKYGNLYVKDLYGYKNTFLYYKSLGGEIGDELYLEVKNEQESQNIPFTEEELVYKLLTKQCGSLGYKGKKRRGRLHKEFKSYRSKGKDEGYQAGLSDGGEERTVEGRLNGGIGELKGGDYSNAMGWAEKVIEKGGSFQNMSKIPFLMMFSGIAYGFERSMTDKIKNMCSKSMLIPITRFMSFKSDIDLANDTILELSKRLGKLYPSKFPDIEERAKKIYGNIHNSGMPERDKISETELFYDDYGKSLIDALFMLNDGKTGELSDINKIILIEKDDFIDENGKKQPGNKKFKKYYDQFTGYMAGDASFDKNEGLIMDSFNKAGISGMDMKKSTLELLPQGNLGNFRHKGGIILWEEIYTELEAISKRDYSKHGGRFAQEKILKDQLRKLVSGLLENNGTRVDILDSFNKPGGTFATKFNKWGLNLSKFAKNGISYEILLNGESQVGEEILDEVVSNMLDGRDMTNIIEDYDSGKGLGGIINDFKDDVDESLENEK
ncbi:hypothetical protein CSB07_00175 [Candidatus Gracilibacteria bacterium]|nr:MAG: hypothetical protein CSB07_00175 [Candidatus Gracilibacteria bacterium]PIE85641.1 MAG: hypothetical protein CSA08_00885 [Candidatus Gracilibacteria bacterium]